MISPKDMGIIEIDITNACVHSCSNCTRFCGHHEKPYFMDLEYFKKAVDSLAKYEGQIGIIGGEPTLHPNLEEIVDYVRLNRTKKQCHHSMGPISDMQFHIDSAVNTNNNTKAVFLSSLSKGYYEYFEVINDTFEHQLLNDHGSESLHQALLISRKELGISDEEWLIKRDKCWIQNTWSASVTPKGAFFCEVAGALDMLFHGPGGWDIESEWWKREPSEFTEQLHWCEICSACLDAPKRLSHDERDDVSPKLYQKLIEINSPKAKSGKVVVRQPEDFAKYRSDSYVTGSEYIQAGNGIRITSQNRNLFPHKIEYLTNDSNINIGGKSGDWYFMFSGENREKWSAFLGKKVWNPGCLYIIDDENIFFSSRARALRGRTISTTLSKSELLSFYPNDKIIYVYTDDPLLFLLGGQQKESWEKYDRRTKHLLVYGAGEIGKKVIQKLDKAGIDDYDIVVTDLSQTENIDGHVIHNLADFKEKSNDILVLLATKYPLHDEMIDILKKEDFPYWCTLA